MLLFIKTLVTHSISYEAVLLTFNPREFQGQIKERYTKGIHAHIAEARDPKIRIENRVTAIMIKIEIKTHKNSERPKRVKEVMVHKTQFPLL
jgi:hypothetical protein